MSGSTTNDANRTERQQATRSLVARARDAAGRLGGPNRRGTIAMLAGGALLASAKSGRGRLRSALAALGGLGLVAYGVRQRLSGGRRGGGEGGRGPHDRPDGGTGATDEGGGGTESMRAESHTGANPRDVRDGPDVDDRTGDDEGRVRFTTDHEAEPRPDPDLEAETGEADTRHPGESEEGDASDGDAVEVDISEAAMADEPNEAAGPTPEQAYPAQVEDTEPDPSPEADASHVEADEPATDADDARDETAGGPGEPAGGQDGDDVSSEDRYEGERGEDATVDSDDGDRGEIDDDGDRGETDDDGAHVETDNGDDDQTG